MRKMIIFAPQYDDSVSYGVAVERNRQNSETEHAVEYVCYRRTLSGFSVSRGVWRCLFYLKGGRGALFFVLVWVWSRLWDADGMLRKRDV